MESETAKEYKLRSLSIREEIVEDRLPPIDYPPRKHIDFLGREIKAGDYICYTGGKELRVALVLETVYGKNRHYHVQRAHIDKGISSKAPKLKVRAGYAGILYEGEYGHGPDVKFVRISQLWGTVTLDVLDRVMIIDPNSVPETVKHTLSKKEE